MFRLVFRILFEGDPDDVASWRFSRVANLTDHRPTRPGATARPIEEDLSDPVPAVQAALDPDPRAAVADVDQRPLNVRATAQLGYQDLALTCTPIGLAMITVGHD